MPVVIDYSPTHKKYSPNATEAAVPVIVKNRVTLDYLLAEATGTLGKLS